MTALAPAEIARRIERAQELEQSGQVLQAELLVLGVLEASPGHVGAATAVARLAFARGDAARAAQFLGAALASESANAALAMDFAVASLASGEPQRAADALEAALERSPSVAPAWLLLGRVRESRGDAAGALKAWYQAVSRAQRAGEWVDEASTPPALLPAVMNAIDALRRGQRELFFGAFEDLKRKYGADALRRVDRALAGHLGDWHAAPSHPRQRPKFFHFPDLPDTPYLDPRLQPWAGQLEAAFVPIRDEALRTLDEDQRFAHFVEPPDGASMQDYVAGEGADAAWEAFFFYRHGERFDANHRRCPRTSEVLESVELCRIADQAPEICYSVLKPGTHIKPHHGVSNIRVVMHLPLVVPPDCALNLLDVGEHRWQEGRLMMFDDTFEHEAWNRSKATRIVLLMDCWNPHLTDVEKLALKALVETITGLQQSRRPRRPPPG